MQDHTSKCAHECEFSDRAYSRERIIASHLKTDRSSDNSKINLPIKIHKCDLCQKAFANKFQLTRHSVVHSKERPFKCDFCKQTFNRKETLTVHETRHSDERPFNCDTCGKSFKRRPLLKVR